MIRFNSRIFLLESDADSNSISKPSTLIGIILLLEDGKEIVARAMLKEKDGEEVLAERERVGERKEQERNESER